MKMKIHQLKSIGQKEDRPKRKADITKCLYQQI